MRKFIRIDVQSHRDYSAMHIVERRGDHLVRPGMIAVYLRG